MLKNIYLKIDIKENIQKAYVQRGTVKNPRKTLDFSNTALNVTKNYFSEKTFLKHYNESLNTNLLLSQHMHQPVTLGS